MHFSTPVPPVPSKFNHRGQTMNYRILQREEGSGAAAGHSRYPRQPVPRLNKSEVADKLRARVSQELRNLRESQQAAQDGAIHEETRQEDPKDTRAIEAQYVARGFAERVEDLEKTVAVLAHMRLDAFGPDDPIDLSALVSVTDSGGEKIYLFVPVAGGETLTLKGGTVQTLTPGSPLGLALCGKCVDDDIELDLPGRRVVATVDWVR